MLDSAAAQKTIYHTKLAEQFTTWFNPLKRMYNALRIPILSKTVVRKKFQHLANFDRNHKKNSVPQFEIEMRKLFNIAKCSCYIETQSNECRCITKNQIPSTMLEIYRDQMDARNYKFICDCTDDHCIKLLHGCELLVMPMPDLDRGGDQQCMPLPDLSHSESPQDGTSIDELDRTMS